MKTCARAAIALAAMGLGWQVAPAAAAPGRPEHCVVHVVDQAPSGELIVSEPECYGSFSEAMAEEGVAAWGSGASVQAAGGTFTIGTHYDGFSFTGASTSVVGSNCSGGWLNVSASWNNRISSTEHGCPRIRHFSGTNLSGSYQTTLAPGGNLSGTMNNQTSSIQYLT